MEYRRNLSSNSRNDASSEDGRRSLAVRNNQPIPNVRHGYPYPNNPFQYYPHFWPYHIPYYPPPPPFPAYYPPMWPPMNSIPPNVPQSSNSQLPSNIPNIAHNPNKRKLFNRSFFRDETCRASSSFEDAYALLNLRFGGFNSDNKKLLLADGVDKGKENGIPFLARNYKCRD